MLRRVRKAYMSKVWKPLLIHREKVRLSPSVLLCRALSPQGKEAHKKTVLFRAEVLSTRNYNTRNDNYGLNFSATGTV